MIEKEVGTFYFYCLFFLMNLIFISLCFSWQQETCKLHTEIIDIFKMNILNSSGPEASSKMRNDSGGGLAVGGEHNSGHFQPLDSSHSDSHSFSHSSTPNSFVSTPSPSSIEISSNHNHNNAATMANHNQASNSMGHIPQFMQKQKHFGNLDPLTMINTNTTTNSSSFDYQRSLNRNKVSLL